MKRSNYRENSTSEASAAANLVEEQPSAIPGAFVQAAPSTMQQHVIQEGAAVISYRENARTSGQRKTSSETKGMDANGIRQRSKPAVASREERFLRAFGDNFIKLRIDVSDLTKEEGEKVYKFLIPQVQEFVKCRDYSSNKQKGVRDLTKFINKAYEVSLMAVKVGSLEIIVECPTLRSLEHLWNDYLSGHLNKVAERYLVTDEMNTKLGLETINLKATIDEENYLACRKFLTKIPVEADCVSIQDLFDLEASTREMNTPADYSAAKDQDTSCTMRIEKAKVSRSALHRASINGQYEEVKRHLKNGANVDERDQFLLTPLHLACWYGHECVVKLLLDHNADVNAADRFQFTPLQKAERCNHQSIIQLLLDHDAKPSLQQPTENLMESNRILVTAFPEDTTETDLVIYFQSETYSGGGDVEDVQLIRNPLRAVISFVDPTAAARVISRPHHLFRNCQLKIFSLANQVSKQEDKQDIQLRNYSPKFNVFYDAMKPEKAMQSNTKTNISNAPNCDSDDHNWAHVEVRQNDSLKQPDNGNAEPTTSQSSQKCRILVDGLPNNATDDLVWNYFENKRRSSGGPVSQVVMNSESRTCQVTFECPDDASRAAQQSTHKLHGVHVCVSLIEEFEMEEKDDSLEDKADELEEDLTIIVSGLPPSATEDAVCYYFENSRRSGGGEVLKIDFNDIDNGKAMLTFKDVSDLQRLLEGEHKINKKPIEVRRRPPKKKLPPDPVGVHVQGLNLEKTSKDCLALYLEKFSNVEVKEMYFGPNDNALAVFNEEPDFPTLFDKVHKDSKGVEGRKPRLERVAVCTCIQVTGLKVESSDDTIELYFENEKRSGGKDVQMVERKWKDEALVFFEDPSSVESVIRKEHKLEGNKLTVMAYYPFLHNTMKEKADIQLDSDVLKFIQRNHDSELQEVSKELKIQIEHSKKPQSPVIISISPADNKKDSNQSWDGRVEDLKNFLNNFQKSHLDIPSEIFDEIVKRRKEDGSSYGSSDFLITFDDHRRLVEVTGKRPCVDAEMHKIKELSIAVKEDRELMKTVVEVVEDNIPESRLKLLEMSGICEKLQNDHQHLTILVDSIGQKLFLKGPRCLLQEVKVEIFKFISKIVDKTTEIPGKLVDVLRKPEVSRFMLDLLKEKGIGAVLLYDQSQVSNEVTVVGVDSTNAKHAEKILLDAVRERSLRLTPENAALIQSSLWRNFKSSLSPNCMVQVSEDISCSTVWTSGIASYVDECFQKITDFLERNTILRKTIQTECGITMFLSEVWKTKIEEIKKKFADYSIDMRTAPNREGVEVSGTEAGLQKCLPEVDVLIHSIQKRSLQVDKPGMKKFFTKEKGKSILKNTAAKHRCIIITKEHAEDEIAPHHSMNEEEVLGSMQELVCSYVTKQGKKISVLKGDITKENVDVIVNAANGELQHIGGLAAAIVQAGGKEIQDECANYIRDNGPLLEGQIMVSTGGRLTCKKVIHAVGPRWNFEADRLVRGGDETKQERYLKYAVTKSLEEAMKYKSIAIPAISSGVFGFPRDLCAKVIMDALLEFCRENAACRLSEIHLINNDSTTVRVFEAEMKKRFAAERDFSDYKDQSPDTAFSLGANNGPGVFGMSKTSRSLITPQGIRITMKAGDLAKEQADIIVGTAASNLNLNQNPCAKALSRAAGPILQQECSNIGQVAVGDIAVNHSPGNLQCKAVIFAICCEWSKTGAREVLKGLLQKCLQTASSKGMASICFPSIGTGTLQFPRAEVAKIYFDEVLSFSQKNPQTSIKEIGFVLYDQDVSTVQAFDTELQKRMQGKAPSPVRRPQSSFTTKKPAFSTMKERKQDYLETNVGSLCFKAHPGDITKETTDAIVVISNKDLDIGRGGGAGAAILKEGGQSIQDECSQKGPQPPGSVVITKAGNLKASSILHIVPSQPVTGDSIKSWVITCLQEAEKVKMSSISFPAIGTGNLGLSAKQCATVMLSAIQDFSDQLPSSMQIVKMVVFQEEMMKDVRSAIEEASGKVSQEKPSLFWRAFNLLGLGGSDQTLPQTTLSDLDTALELVIFAGCQEDLQKAFNEINGIIQDNSTRKVIERQAVTMLSSQHYQKIHALELKYDVKATLEKELGRIVVSGMTDDILNVMGEIYSLLDHVKEEEDERKQAEALSKVIQWMYKNVDTDAFEPFEPLVNAKIEAAYDKKKSGVDIGDGQYRVDFKLMNMEIRDCGVTDVKRVNQSDLLPKHWTPQPKDQDGFEKTVHLYQLDPSNDAKEYQRVESQFRQTCPNNIVKIERVQNPALYETYAIRKKKMDETKGSNEMNLFHGTPGNNCKLINHKGFNRSFHGKNATVYGNGVYFALQSSYSARSTYSPPDANGYRYMYLTKVLVGEYTNGKQGLITPPPKSAADPTDTYDTVVDQIPNPSIFVVFYDWQCYPEYLITFQ
ncbi:protein mono-ADP-ribosyltransferase PARP14-like [Montipora capricornis]|uniref:protein mono-ADP-ribosyltransferase PARP14-like n=1 Tax=Montipora capricornis TaxID=246305 RepID=UPI0035F1D2DC